MTKKIIASTLLSAGILATPGIAFASLPSDDSSSQESEKHVTFGVSTEENSNPYETPNPHETPNPYYTETIAEETQPNPEKEENEPVDELPAEETAESNEDTPQLCPFPCLLV